MFPDDARQAPHDVDDFKDTTPIHRFVQPAEIEQVVHEALPQARVEARDTTGTGDHWHVVVVDDAFEGLLPVKRQRLVMEPFKSLIASDRVHALDLVTVTPKEAAERGLQGPSSGSAPEGVSDR